MARNSAMRETDSYAAAWKDYKRRRRLLWITALTYIQAKSLYFDLGDVPAPDT
jgi:hypothetical protein